MVRIRENEVEMYIEFEYYRVPDFWFVRQNRTGRPHPSLLYEYRKGLGFADLPNNVKPCSKGGKVVCNLVDSRWEEDCYIYVLSGTSNCSMSDTFSYKIGKKLALLRATNLGLGHELDSGLMFRLDNLDKADDETKIHLLNIHLISYLEKLKNAPNTLYFHPETAKIMPEIIGFRVKTSIIILKNHVWMGFEAE